MHVDQRQIGRGRRRQLHGLGGRGGRAEHLVPDRFQIEALLQRDQHLVLDQQDPHAP
ncbi:hypothetical protein ACIU1J_18815 [Azospirillum doebereinerae]|uniref:hypothetical protein n=1 Tax=Azospirillum doebereinerae TaxID=92933 RepID=UPI00384D0B09